MYREDKFAGILGIWNISFLALIGLADCHVNYRLALIQLCIRRVTYVQNFSFFDNHKIFRGLDWVSLTVLEFFHVDKHLSDIFTTKKGLKQGDALPPKLFNFALNMPLGGYMLTRMA